MTVIARSTPLEWLNSLGNFLNIFYEEQCSAVRKANSSAQTPRQKKNSNTTASVKKTPATIRKLDQNKQRRSSFLPSTPLKEKSPNVSGAVSLIESATPQPPSKLAVCTSETPFTESRARRTAATKADKYIDIVARRLAEVPANGSTPKSMKITSKLISAASPNSRRGILLSQSMAKASNNNNNNNNLIVPSTPKLQKATDAVPPVATPMSVRKRNRTAKIHKMFETPLMSLASVASSSESSIIDNNGSSCSLSPAAIDIVPSTIQKSSKLSQMHTTSSLETPQKTTSPLKMTIRTSPALKRSQRPSPLREAARVSAIKSFVNTSVTQATPRAPLVEFVAPQSVLRSSKRPRKQIDSSLFDESSGKTPIKRQNNFAEMFPTVLINHESHIKLTQNQQQQPPSTHAPLTQNTRISNVPVNGNVPSIIIPLSVNSKTEESTSSNEDLVNLASDSASFSSKKTPLRVQPARTPTRAKAVIPSLSNYSSATKIAVIEVAKNANSTSSSSATPKVEPWTAKFMQQKDVPTSSSVNIAKSSLNITVKPVDTSKISGFSTLTSASIPAASVPIVPKFPLNLANISNITKPASLTTLPITQPVLSVNTISAAEANAVIPPESPLTRAKRIDSENTSREERFKTIMENRSEKLKRAMGDLKNNATGSESQIQTQISTETQSQQQSTTTHTQNTHSTVQKPSLTQNELGQVSKLPVKPKVISSNGLPGPKVPSRLAEAFTGIDSELPPIDIEIGLVEDEKALRSVLASGSTVTTSTTVSSTNFTNPKMKKTPAVTTLKSTSAAVPVATTTITETPTSNAQLHRTAVLNSAARKINPPPSTPLKASNATTTTNTLTTASTPLNTSSPILPEIFSDDELDRREKPAGKENRPVWATTPNLAVALNAQRSQRAEDVFGKVQPIKLEDFFKGSGKKFPNRSSTSNWNNNI